MAILALLTGQGWTAAMYDTLRAEVNWEHQQPNGAIMHVFSVDDTGNAHVSDVWRSPEELNQFVNTRLGPAMQRLNFPMPDMQVFPIHNIDAYAHVTQFIRQ